MPRLTALAFLAVSVLAHLGLLQASRSPVPPPVAKAVTVRLLEPEVAPAVAVPAPQPPAAQPKAAKREPVRAKTAKAPAKRSSPHGSTQPPRRAGPARATAARGTAASSTAASDTAVATAAHAAPVVHAPPESSLSLPEFDDSLDVAAVFAEPTPLPAGDAAGHAVPRATATPPAMATAPATALPSASSSVPELATAEPVSAAAAPGIVEVPTISGRAQYRVHFGDPDDGNVVAMLEESFELGAGQYRLRSEGHAKGLISFFYRGALLQESEGIVSTSGLQPTLYREKRGNRPARQSSIDPARGVAVFPSGAHEPAPPGVQDRLSIFVQLALLRASFPERFAVGDTIRLPVLASSHVDSSVWQVIGHEPVTTDAGEVPAVRLQRAPTDDEDPTVDLWLALDSRILPVRMRATEPNGRALDQVLVGR